MAAARSQLTTEQKEFIVRKLAAFYTPRDIAQQLAAKFDLKCNENDVLATDPRINLLAPELHALYSVERERILLDPHSDPYTDQKARLISLSRQAERYESNNQPADARQVYRQIAEELGVVGGKASAGKAVPAPSDVPPEIVAITRKIVHPTKTDEPAA